MTLIRQAPVDMIVEISDMVEEGTIIKRKVELQSLQYSPKEKQVSINLLVYPFALGPVDTNITGSTVYKYGKSLTGINGFQPYFKQLVANMSTLVDATTGELLCDASLLDDSETNSEGGILHGREVMYEYEYFKKLSATTPVIVDQLITNKIMQADAAGKI